MIKVLIPKDEDFKLYKKECKTLYEKVQAQICDTNSFDFICNNTFFYAFLDETSLIGCIYYFLDEDGRLYLNAFSKPKMYPINVECLKLSTNWFKGEIFAEAQNRASARCLLKAGFKKIEKNLFIKKGGLND